MIFFGGYYGFFNPISPHSLPSMSSFIAFWDGKDSLSTKAFYVIFTIF